MSPTCCSFVLRRASEKCRCASRSVRIVGASFANYSRRVCCSHLSALCWEFCSPIGAHASSPADCLTVFHGLLKRVSICGCCCSHSPCRSSPDCCLDSHPLYRLHD